MIRFSSSVIVFGDWVKLVETLLPNFLEPTNCLHLSVSAWHEGSEQP